jgi:hypothetical protein
VLGAEHHGLLQRGDDALRDVVRTLGLVEIVDEDRELVAAEPSGRVALAEAAHDPLTHDTEQVVAGRVPEAVVDGLEVVEVDEQYGELTAVPLQPRRGVIDPITEERLVGQPRQRVVERLMDQLALQATVLGHVAEAPHPADDLTTDPLGE